MTLSDADVDRWSRQILLPEVGGRGQQRLLATRVGLRRPRHPHPVADAVEDLLARAGVSAVSNPSADDLDLLIDVGSDIRDTAPTRVPLIRGVSHGAAVSVLTLVGRPCACCASRDAVPDDTPAGDDRLAGAAAAACAALVAAEALRTLLDLPEAGRRQRIDLRRGTFAGETLETEGCGLCRESHG